MTFDHFKELTALMVESTAKEDRAYDLGINVYDHLEEKEVLIHKLWSLILTDHGLDWFNWFMYEKKYIRDGVGDPEFNAHSDGVPICEDLKGLYEYLVKNNYFKIPVEDAKSTS